MVISQKDYQEIELNEPSRIFRESGFTVVVASKEAGAATSMGNEKATADIAVRNALLSDYVAVVFVGGMGVYDGKLAFDPEFKSLAEMAGKRDMVVGAICLAPMILANAGVITGRNATVSPMQEAVELLMQSGANYTEKGVVVDGKVITASGPDESEEFAMAVVDAIGALGTYPAAEKGTVVEKGGTLALQGVNNPPSGAAPGGPVSASSPATMSKYRCTTCSYVYDPQVGDVTGGIAAGTPFENLPASWRCPICGASKDLFVKA
jgi:protease I